MHLLIIEDDPTTANYLAKGFREQGYTVDHCDNGVDGLFAASQPGLDLIITDRMLPGLDGLSVIRSLRSRGVRTPVLILSALAQVDDRVCGLKEGGDDYLVKPFAFAELLARADSLLRRATPDGNPTTLRVADLELNLLSRDVRRAGLALTLKSQEFRLLEYLMRHAGQVVTRTMLLEGVWDYHFDPQTNVIDVHISRIRQKIDKGFDKPLLHTIRGAGYMLREET